MSSPPPASHPPHSIRGADKLLSLQQWGDRAIEPPGQDSAKTGGSLGWEVTSAAGQCSELPIPIGEPFLCRSHDQHCKMTRWIWP